MPQTWFALVQRRRRLISLRERKAWARLEKALRGAALYGMGTISRSLQQATACMAVLLLLVHAALAPGLGPLWMPAVDLGQNGVGNFTIICTPQGMARVALPGSEDPAPKSPSHDGRHDCPACLACVCNLSVIMSDAAAIAFPAIEETPRQPQRSVPILSANCSTLSIRGPPSVLLM